MSQLNSTTTCMNTQLVLTVPWVTTLLDPTWPQGTHKTTEPCTMLLDKTPNPTQHGTKKLTKLCDQTYLNTTPKGSTSIAQSSAVQINGTSISTQYNPLPFTVTSGGTHRSYQSTTQDPIRLSVPQFITT